MNDLDRFGNADKKWLCCTTKTRPYFSSKVFFRFLLVQKMWMFILPLLWLLRFEPLQPPPLCIYLILEKETANLNRSWEENITKSYWCHNYFQHQNYVPFFIYVIPPLVTIGLLLLQIGITDNVDTSSWKLRLFQISSILGYINFVLLFLLGYFFFGRYILRYCHGEETFVWIWVLTGFSFSIFFLDSVTFVCVSVKNTNVNKLNEV